MGWTAEISDVIVRLRKEPRGVFIAMAFATRATALHAAALMGNIGALNLLLEHDADPASTVHSHAVTPLHLAAYNGHEAIVKRLLEAGSPVRVRDKRMISEVIYIRLRSRGSDRFTFEENRPPPAVYFRSILHLILGG